MIVLLRPSSSDSELSESLTRIQGELVADGFRVEAVSVNAAPTSDQLLQIAAQRPDAAAVVALFEAGGDHGVELWIAEQSAGAVAVVRAQLNLASQSGEGGGGPEVLARRAVETLRATLLRLSVLPAVKPPSPPERPSQSVHRAQPGTGASPVLRPEVGVLAIRAVRGPSLAVMPVIGLRLALGRAFMSRISIAGLGTSASVRSTQGSARVTQELALLEVASWLSRPGTLRANVGLGTGAYHVVAQAQATTPYQASRAGQWALAAEAFGGASVSLSRRWDLGLEFHALLSAPYPVVRFVGAEVARLGRPSFFGVLTIAGWL